MLAVLVGSILLDGSRALIAGRVARRIDLRLHRVLLGRLSSESSHYREVLRDFDIIRSFVGGPTTMAILDAPWSSAFLVAIFLLHPILGFLTLAAIGLIGLTGIAGYLVSRKSATAFSTHSNETHQTLEHMREIGSVLGTMGHRTFLVDGLFRTRLCTSRVAGKLHDRQSWLEALARGIRNAVQAAVITTTAVLVVKHEIQPGSIVASSMLFSRALVPFERLGAGLNAVLVFWSACKRTRQRLRGEDRLRKLPLPDIVGAVTVRDLCFSEAGNKRLILNGLNFTVNRGTVLTIVGPEGAGKSTLGQLLVGLTLPGAGEVRIDGSKIDDLDALQFGRQVGYLPQNSRLGFGSIADIIARGEEPDPADVAAAAILVGAHTMIQTLPHGYQTVVGRENLCRISGGELQRIALARSVYRRPSLIVLDEPTTHLDDEGEANVVAAIRSLKEGGSTIVVISRSPGLLSVTDKLMMLDGGRIRIFADREELQPLKPRLAASN